MRRDRRRQRDPVGNPVGVGQTFGRGRQILQPQNPAQPLVLRISGGCRSFAYGLAPNENHPAHPHFRCRSCGVLQCLQPGLGDRRRESLGAKPEIGEQRRIGAERDQQMPQNGNVHEIRGEILLKANRPADAAKAFRTALKLDPGKGATIQVGLGQSLLLAGDADGAIRELGEALRRDKTNAVGYEYLARAYAQTGREPDALLATAQMYYYNGAIKDARIFAARAQQGFKKGSPGWLRAGDIINSGAKPAKKS